MKCLSVLTDCNLPHKIRLAFSTVQLSASDESGSQTCAPDQLVIDPLPLEAEAFQDLAGSLITTLRTTMTLSHTTVTLSETKSWGALSQTTRAYPSSQPCEVTSPEN